MKISISMVVGENGILNSSIKAKEEHRAGTVEERVALWKYEKLMPNPDETTKTRDEMMYELYQEKLLTKLELNKGKFEETVQVVSKKINFGEDDGDGNSDLYSFYNIGGLTSSGHRYMAEKLAWEFEKILNFEFN